MANKRGPKNKFKQCVEPHLKWINEQVRNGVIEEEIAKELGISVASLNNYKQQYPELKEALSKGKGKAVLQDLINAGIEAAKGYYRENETTTISLDDKGNPVKRQKVITKVWYKPDAALNKFYVSNFGKDEGFTNDPLDYELKKAKADFEAEIQKNKDWYK